MRHNLRFTPSFLFLAILASLTTPVPVVGQGQGLTLGDALDRADRLGYGNRASRAMATSAAAAPTAALRGVLPSVRFDAGLVRTTDPIGAFGTTLRQRAITQQDFDPSRLNYPPVAANYMGAMVLEQPILNADAWVGRRAATRAADAARATADWAAIGTRIDVVKAYFGAVLAQEKVATLTIAVRAARAHVRQAEQMARNGLVTPSDAMLASVKAGEAETMLIEATGESQIAKLALATILGAPNDTAFTLPSVLPGDTPVRAIAQAALDASASGTRGDVESAARSLDAASADAMRARALYLPRVNGFARYDWNSAFRPYGGERNWTVGVMATWSPFAGASEIAEVQGTSARRSAAEAMHDGAVARAFVEVEQSTNVLRTAMARLDIAQRSATQSVDAHRIVARKYDGGLASVVELLDAASIETQTRLALSGARYALIVAAAERRRAIGLDPGAVRALDATSTASQTSPEP